MSPRHTPDAYNIPENIRSERMLADISAQFKIVSAPSRRLHFRYYDTFDWRVFRHLARLPSELQIATLPQAYIEADEPTLSMLVHDFQNKLLNIQLRSELFGRISGRQIRTPPSKLSDQNAPIHERIQGIYEHLAWWSDYHTSEMEHLLADSS